MQLAEKLHFAEVRIAELEQGSSGDSGEIREELDTLRKELALAHDDTTQLQSQLSALEEEERIWTMRLSTLEEYSYLFCETHYTSRVSLPSLEGGHVTSRDPTALIGGNRESKEPRGKRTRNVRTGTYQAVAPSRAKSSRVAKIEDRIVLDKIRRCVTASSKSQYLFCFPRYLVEIRWGGDSEPRCR